MNLGQALFELTSTFIGSDGRCVHEFRLLFLYLGQTLFDLCPGTFTIR